MRNFNKVKALERLYAELSRQEADASVPYQSIPFTVTLFSQDLGHILDVLSQAIAEERR